MAEGTFATWPGPSAPAKQRCHEACRTNCCSCTHAGLHKYQVMILASVYCASCATQKVRDKVAADLTQCQQFVWTVLLNCFTCKGGLCSASVHPAPLVGEQLIAFAPLELCNCFLVEVAGPRHVQVRLSALCRLQLLNLVPVAVLSACRSLLWYLVLV